MRSQLAAALILVALGCGYICWYGAVYGAYPADDAYIHMRIARHMAEHGQPYYNLGEPVAASSSPLWLLVLSAVFALGGPNASAVLPLTVAMTLGAFLALAAALSQRVGRCTAVGSAALIVVLGLLPATPLQMEAPLALLFWALSLVCLQRNAYGYAGLFAALGCCTRYEVGLWLLIVLLSVARDGVARRHLLLGAVGPLLALAVFNMVYFGSLLPNTIRAKSTIYELSFTSSLSTSGMLPLPWVFFAVLASGGALCLLLLRHAPTRIAGLALLFGLSLLTLYLGRGVLIFPWYPPLYLVPIFFGLCHGLLSAQLRTALFAAILTLLILVPVTTSTVDEAHGLLSGQPLAYREAEAGLRVYRYLTIGADLAREFPGASLMTSEVGGLGWSFTGRIIDGAGLISPELLRYHPMAVPQERSHGGLGAIPPQAIRDERPDLIVSMETFSEALRRDYTAGLLPEYRLLRREPVLDDPLLPDAAERPFWGTTYTEIYVRRSVAGQ